MPEKNATGTALIFKKISYTCFSILAQSSLSPKRKKQHKKYRSVISDIFDGTIGVQSPNLISIGTVLLSLVCFLFRRRLLFEEMILNIELFLFSRYECFCQTWFINIFYPSFHSLNNVFCQENFKLFSFMDQVFGIFDVFKELFV